MLMKWKMITCQLGEEDDEKKKKKCSDVVTCWFQQSPWQKKRETKGRQRRKEGTAKSLHHTCQMCHNHTQGCTADLQYSWRNP